MTTSTEPTRVTAAELEALCAPPEPFIPGGMWDDEQVQPHARYSSGGKTIYPTGIAQRLFNGLDAIAHRQKSAVKIELGRIGTLKFSWPGRDDGGEDIDFHLIIDSPAAGHRSVHLDGYVTMHRDQYGAITFGRWTSECESDESTRPPAMFEISVSNSEGEDLTIFEVPTEMAMPSIKDVIIQHIMTQAAFPHTERPTRFESANQAVYCWRNDHVWLVISDDGQPIVAVAGRGWIHYVDQPQATKRWLAIDHQPEVDWPNGIVPAAEFDGCGTIVVIPTTADQALI